MNKIKEALHLGGHKEDDSKHGSHTSEKARQDGLEFSQSEGRNAYVSGNPNYAGQTAHTHNHHEKPDLDFKNDPKHSGKHDGHLYSAPGYSGEPTTGTTGSTGRFDAHDPVESGDRIHGTQYNDRTGHTHPTTGSHHAAFEQDPTSASTGNDSYLRRPSMAPTTSSALSVKSGIVGQPGGIDVVPVAVPVSLPDRSLEHEHSHGEFGHTHTTFTANILDPATYKEEHVPTFHEEHVHGGHVEHGNPEISTEQYAREHYDPRKGPDFLGRDVALGGAGVGAAGLASTSGLGSSTSGYGDSTGPASNTVGPHSSNVLNTIDPRVQPDFAAQGSGHHTGRDAGLVAGGLGAGALGASAYEHEQSGPAQRYNQQTFGDSTLTGQSGQSVPGPTGSGHNIGYQQAPDFVGRDVGSQSYAAPHHDDHMKHKSILTPSTAVSHEGERHSAGGYADTSKLTDGRDYGSSNTGSSAAGGAFGAELPAREPHHYYDHNNNTSSSSGQQGGNSSFRRSGYSKRDPSDSSSYDPAAANYGSSSAIGTTDGYESRGAAAQGLTFSEDPTTGLEGTTAHHGRNVLHKEPKEGYLDSQQYTTL